MSPLSRTAPLLLATWLTVEQPQLRPVIDEALDTVERIARGDFWHLAQAGERSVETPFLFTESGNQVMSGVIDLMFQDRAAWRIVDYKTDVAKTTLATAYATQLQTYERALASVGLDSSSQIESVRVSEAG